MTNKKDVDIMSGEWVILKDDEIVEQNKDLGVIFELAKNYSDHEITISKLPSATYCFY